jgi:hypothetical protein
LKDQVIGVIGLGRIGGPLSKAFKRAHFGVVEYDRLREIGSLPRVVAYADLIFVCVSTPVERGAGRLDFVREILTRVEKLHFTGVIVLKSRLAPEEVAEFERDFPLLNLVFSPVTEGTNVLCGTRTAVRLVEHALLKLEPGNPIQSFTYLPRGKKVGAS